MQRRLFIKSLGLIGTGSLVAIPQLALAGAQNPMSSALAGSIYYTQAKTRMASEIGDGLLAAFDSNLKVAAPRATLEDEVANGAARRLLSAFTGG